MGFQHQGIKSSDFKLIAFSVLGIVYIECIQIMYVLYIFFDYIFNEVSIVCLIYLCSCRYPYLYNNDPLLDLLTVKSDWKRKNRSITLFRCMYYDL